MIKNVRVKNLSGQDVIKVMRQIGAGIERRLGVQIEGVEHKIDLVIERQNGLEENLNSRFDSLDEKVDKLVTDVDIIKVDVVVIKGDLKKKADASETVALRRRVAVLEGSK